MQHTAEASVCIANKSSPPTWYMQNDEGCMCSQSSKDFRSSQRFVGLLNCNRQCYSQSNSYLDLRFQVYSRKHWDFFNLHGCALPMHKCHTGQVMYDMLCKFFCPYPKMASFNVGCRVWWSLQHDWASCWGCDKTAELHARQLSSIQNMVQSPPTGPSYGAYDDWGGWQLFLQCHAQIFSHLSRQQKLIADMGTTCPRVVNCWLSIHKVTNWFKTYWIDRLHLRIRHLHRRDYGGSILLLCKVLQTTRPKHSSTYKDQHCYYLNSLQLSISWLELSLKMLVLRGPSHTMFFLFAIPRRLFQVDNIQYHPWLKFGSTFVPCKLG